MTENEAIHDLKFIKKGYENLAKNGADSYRAVGKGVDCSVQVETNEDLYKHYVDTMNIAIQALEKQIPKKVKGKHISISIEEQRLLGKDTLYGECPNCGELLCDLWNSENCGDCGQALDWSD